MIIAIDGPSGTGKSTIAHLLAVRLGFVYFNTGAMYRALAFKVLKRSHSVDEDREIFQVLQDFEFDIQLSQGNYSYWVNGENITDHLWQEEISLAASAIAKKQFVRERLLPIQRSFGSKKDVVFEGRDIGTVVFPEAELKIFLTATPEIRAKRRLKQLQEKFPSNKSSLRFEDVLKDVIARDKQDSTRDIAPLKKAADAIEVDTSNLSIEQVLDEIIAKKNRKEKI